MSSKKHIALLGMVCITTKLMAHDPTQTPPPSVSLKAKPIKKIKEKTSSKKQSRKITVKNGITDSMTSYKKFGTKHKPTTFTVRVNGQTVPQGKAAKIVVTDQPVDVEYYFDFYGIRKETRKESFMLDPETTSTELTFTWCDKHKVKLNGAKVIKK